MIDIQAKILYESVGANPTAPTKLVLGSVAPLACFPGNPSIFEQWALEPINCGKKEQRFTHFLLKNEIEA